MADDKKMETIPFDPRFPNQNQTRNCWQNYVDFHRCQKIKVGRQEEMTKSLFGMIMNAKRCIYGDEIGFARGDIIYGNLQGEESEPCQFFLKNFKTVCPAAWVEKWDEQREKVRILFWPIFTSLFFSGRLPRQHLEPHRCV